MPPWAVAPLLPWLVGGRSQSDLVGLSYWDSASVRPQDQGRHGPLPGHAWRARPAVRQEGGTPLARDS
jgi:hypothetical protein